MPHSEILESKPQRRGMQGTQTLDRSFEILQVIAARGARGASIDELSADTHLSRATLYRLLKAMKSYGFIRTPRVRGHYFLGYELLSLGAQAGNTGGVRELSRPALMRLAERFGDTFFLFVPDGYFALCLEMQQGAHLTQRFAQSIGARILMGVGQASIALLAYQPPAKRNEILHHNAPRLAREYAIETAQVRRAIMRMQQERFSCGIADKCLPSYTGLAVPLLDNTGAPVAALSCAMQATRLTAGYKAHLADAMRLEADAIMSRLGEA